MALITQAYAELQLAPLGLSAAQLAALPAALDSASEAIERHCRRSFARADRDEVAEPAWDGTAILAHYPVNAVSRIAGGRRGVLRISNASAAAQRATVAFSYGPTADFETGLTPTGLLLRRVASAVVSDTALLFAAYPTLAELAAAVVALGNGWSAEVEGGYGPWASSDLAGGEAVQGALGVGAVLDVFAEDLGAGDYALDRGAGILRLAGGGAGEDPYFDGLPVGGAGRWSEVRVQYNAGYQTIPAGLQDACVEAVKAALVGLALDPAVSAESAGQYSYSYDFRDKGVRLPESVLRMLAPYRDLRA